MMGRYWRIAISGPGHFTTWQQNSKISSKMPVSNDSRIRDVHPYQHCWKGLVQPLFLGGVLDRCHFSASSSQTCLMDGFNPHQKEKIIESTCQNYTIHIRWYVKKYIPIGREAGSLYSLSTFVWPLRKRHVWPTHCPFPKFPKVKISSQRLSNYHVVGKNPTGPTNAFAWEHGLSLHPPLYSLDGSLYRCIQQYKKKHLIGAVVSMVSLWIPCCWVIYNVSATWNKSVWGWFQWFPPQKKNVSLRPQGGR